MNKRVLVLAAVGVAVAAAAVVAIVSTTSSDGGDPGSAVAASPHDGMVSGTVWVANEDGASLTAIDAARNEVLTTLTGIEGPHNVQVSPDGRNVWAVSGHESQAIMVDAAGFGLHGAVPTGKEPAHVILTPDGRSPCGNAPTGIVASCFIVATSMTVTVSSAPFVV
jgi:DNA-binding beta-propeller fold protein YncE